MDDPKLIPYARTADLIRSVARVTALDAMRHAVTTMEREYAEAAAEELNCRVPVPPDPMDE